MRATCGFDSALAGCRHLAVVHRPTKRHGQYRLDLGELISNIVVAVDAISGSLAPQLMSIRILVGGDEIRQSVVGRTLALKVYFVCISRGENFPCGGNSEHHSSHPRRTRSPGGDSTGGVYTFVLVIGEFYFLGAADPLQFSCASAHGHASTTRGMSSDDPLWIAPHRAVVCGRGCVMSA